MLVISAQLELLILSLGQLYLKLKWLLTYNFCKNILNITNHLGYIMMSIDTSIMINLSCSLYLLVFTLNTVNSQGNDVMYIIIHVYLIQVFIYISISKYASQHSFVEKLYKDEVNDLSYMYMYLAMPL